MSALEIPQTEAPGNTRIAALKDPLTLTGLFEFALATVPAWVVTLRQVAPLDTLLPRYESVEDARKKNWPRSHERSARESAAGRDRGGARLPVR